MIPGASPRFQAAAVKPRLTVTERRRLFRALFDVDLLLSIFLDDLVRGAYGPVGLAVGRPKGLPRPVAAIEPHPAVDGSISSFNLVFWFPVNLTPKVAALLLILAADWGSSDDDWVGWKPLEQVLATMRAIPGCKDLSRHALTQLVYRLKKELAAVGLSQDLVQWSAARRAYRLARLRKKPEAGTSGGQRTARLF